MATDWLSKVYLNRVGFVISKVERDALAAVIEAAKAGIGEPVTGTAPDVRQVRDGLDALAEALAEHDAEAAVEVGRQARRAEAERLARETPVTNVRIRITKRHPFKGGHVMQRGEVYDVERSVHAEWDPDTREWAPEVGYSYYPPNQKGPGRHGYRIDADSAVEI